MRRVSDAFYYRYLYDAENCYTLQGWLKGTNVGNG
jgi:hypothetical protein